MDKVKSAWKILSKESCNKHISDDEIKKIVEKKSKNELLRIKQKMLIELYISIALFLLLLLFIVITNASNTLYSFVFFAFIVAVSFIPYTMLKKIKIVPDDNLKKYLNDFVYNFKKIYLKVYSFLVPFALIGGVGLGYDYSLKNYIISLSVIEVVFFILLIITLLTVVFLVQKKYFNWLYGKNINRIESILKDLQE